MDEQMPPGGRAPHAREQSGPLPDNGFDLDPSTASPACQAVFALAAERVPEEWEIEGPAFSISLGDAADLDPVLLAAMTGPDGLGGEALGPQFGKDRSADALRPGPILAALTEQAVAETAVLNDDQLTGALQAARRIENRACWQQAVLTAEFARRRQAQLAEATARKVPRGCRPGEFPDDELASELLITRNQAAHRIGADLDLTSRLPRTLAGMAAGLISADRADVIASYTAGLTDEQAAYADEVLAEAAPGLRYDQLARKAAALEMKLDPEAVRARKEHARAARQRVEARREASGNASLAGRELATADAMASKAHIDALAARLRRAGLDGTLDQLRALVFTDVTQGRDPLVRITPAPTPAPADAAGPGPAPSTDQGDPNDLDFDPEQDPDVAPPPSPGPPAPLPALINLIVPAGTLLGWSTAPAQAAGFGLLDPDETRDLVAAASRNPRTRWAVTVTGPDGTATAYGGSPGQHPWNPQDPAPPETPPRRKPSGRTAPQGTSAPGTSRRSRGNPGPSPGPDAAQAARLRDLLRALNVTLEPIARGTCDHRHAEDRYTPSRKLKHLIRARTGTCSAPGCNGQAVHSDLDHVVPYPDGPTCECNLHPACRRHHRAKQAPGWRVEQPEPGVIRWTTPAGRTYTTTPTVYDI